MEAQVVREKGWMKINVTNNYPWVYYACRHGIDQFPFTSMVHSTG